MPVPKRKRSKSRRDKRFANKGIKVKSITQCANCQEALTPHAACRACGFYKGKKVLATKNERTVKRLELKQAKQAKAQAAQSKNEPSETE